MRFFLLEERKNALAQDEVAEPCLAWQLYSNVSRRFTRIDYRQFGFDISLVLGYYGPAICTRNTLKV